MPERSLAARDSVSFLALCGAAVVLFALTLFLFRSFERHRELVGEHLTAEGETALRTGQPDRAVTALRGALTFRDEFSTEVLLAQALTASGQTEEAANYLLNLRETRPGDGFLNLQLARLYRREGDRQLAVESYRSSIFGDWPGDGALRRREARLELAEYLVQQGQPSAGRDELLIASGNAPDTLASALFFGARFLAIGEETNAFQSYKRALQLSPHNYEALAGAGQSAYFLGDYSRAHTLLQSSLDVSFSNAAPHGTSALKNGGDRKEASLAELQQLRLLTANARRMLDMDFSRNLSAKVRSAHLLTDARIAQNRVVSCYVQHPNAVSETAGTPTSDSGIAQSAMGALLAKWQFLSPVLKQRTLERDASVEDQLADLIVETEQTTAKTCGSPQGDDALLLMLANHAPSDTAK